MGPFGILALVLMIVAVVLAFISGEIKGAGFLLWLSIAVMIILGGRAWPMLVM